MPRYAVVPGRSEAWLPLSCRDSPLVEELPLPVPQGWERFPLARQVRVLHRHAAARDVSPLVDVSGADGLGAATPGVPPLLVDLGGAPTPLASVYCASMAFVGGGPYPELLSLPPAAVHRDPRLFSSGKLLGFAMPLPAAVVHTVPAWRWHAWLVVRALAREPLPPAVLSGAGYTAAGARPSFGERGLAFPFAVFAALEDRSLADLALTYPGFSRLLDALL